METCISTQYYRNPKLATFYQLNISGGADLEEVGEEKSISSGQRVVVRPIAYNTTEVFDHFLITGLDGITESNENPFEFTMPDNDVTIVAVYNNIESTELNITPLDVDQMFVNTEIGGYNPVKVKAIEIDVDSTFTQNGFYYPAEGKYFNEVYVDVPQQGGDITIQTSKTATPTDQQQTITPDTGYDALGQVVVNAVPLDSNNTFTQNGTFSAASGEFFKTVNVNVSGGGGSTATSKRWLYTPEHTTNISLSGGETVELVEDTYISEHANDPSLTVIMFAYNTPTYQETSYNAAAFVFGMATANGGQENSVRLNISEAGDDLLRESNTAISMGTILTTPGAFSIVDGVLYFRASRHYYLDEEAEYAIIMTTGVDYGG